MDFVPSPLAASPAASAALPRAEAAATAVETSGAMNRASEIPAPFPTTQAQTGAVNRSRMAEAATADLAPERVLKPWGLPMLPDLAKQEEESETEEDATEAEMIAQAPTTDDANAEHDQIDRADPEALTREDPAQPAPDPFETRPETT